MSVSFNLSNVPRTAWTWLKSKPAIIRYLLIAVLIAVVIVLIVLLWGFLAQLPLWFWELTVLCVLFVAVVWWFTGGAKLYDRRRVLKQELGDLRAGDPASEAQARRNLRTAVTDASTMIHRSPELDTGGHALYRVPWFVFLGDEAASQTRLLKAATGVASPFSAPQKAVAGDLFWTFWFFKRLIAIETSPAFVCDRGDAGPRGIWYHALQLLHEYRELLPANGVVVVVAVERLSEPADKLRTFTLNIRRLVDEAMHHLEVDVPMYVVVTGLERLPGFASFVKHLPAAAKDHAVGERIDWDKPEAWSRWERAGDIFESIRSRFHAIRLAALRRESDRPARKDIFEFVERFAELKEGFGALLHALLDKNPFQHQPKLRGVYFASAGDTPIFVKDLFTRFLPADQSLASRGGRYATRRGLRATLGALCMIALSAGLLFGLVSAYKTDRELAGLARAACPAPIAADTDSDRKLAGLIGCHEKLAYIEQRWRASGLSFGLRFHRKPFREAQGRFVASFNTAVVAPLDNYLSSSISSGSFGPAEYITVLQRLGTLESCKNDAEHCVPFPRQFVFDPQSAQPLHRLLGLKQAVSLKQHDELFASYASFAHWQDASAVGAESSRLNAYLGQMQRTRAWHPEEWLKWAAERYETYALDRFWKPPRPLEPGQRAILPQIPGLFTASFYQQVLFPLQSVAHSYIPAANEALDKFTREYWTAYFRSWAAFFRDFYQGARLWNPDYTGLARQLMQQLPYEALYIDMQQNIWGLPLRVPMSNRLALLWLDIKSDWLDTPHYVARTFRQARAGTAGRGAVDAPTWVLAVTEMHKKMWPDTSAAVKKILQAVQQDASGQQAYALAREVFKTGGAGGAGLAQEFQKLNQPFDAPPDKYVHGIGGDNQIGWAGMKGPARVVLIVLTGRAGQYIQHLWEEDILKSASGMNKAGQDVVLWGDKGKINGFLTDQLADFVSAKEHTPVQILDIGLPFSPGYGVLVNKATAGGTSKEPFPVGVFSFKQASMFGALEEGSGGTEFSLICRGTTVTLKSKAKLVADRTMKMYWSPELCDRARIEVYLPDPPAPAQQPVPAQQPAPSSTPPPPASLAKDYLGPDGFKQLLQDFQSGSKHFALADFKSSYPQPDWPTIAKSVSASGINSVKVHLHIDKSPELDRFLKASEIVAGGLPGSIMQ